MQFPSLLSRFCFKYKLFIVILIAIFYMTLSTGAIAAEQVLSTVTVTGQGKEQIATTLTNVQLGVEVQGKTATEVQQQVAKQTTAVVNFLQSRKVEKLKTTGIQLQPNYDYSSKQQRLIGYLGINTVSFRLNTEKVGNLLDEAVKAGATRIDNVSFTATEEAIAAAQKQALQKAVQDGQAQAEAVLQALNLSAKKIVSIQINGANVPPPQVLQVQQEALSYDKVAISTPVIGGEQTVDASVTLQISY
jgi:hypothetical protein